MLTEAQEIVRKNERSDTYIRRVIQSTSSFLISQQSQNRSINASIMPLQQKKIFGFEIFISNDILISLSNVSEWFQAIKKVTNVKEIKYNDDLTIPDLSGRNIQIFDKEMQKKYQACKVLLSNVYQKFKLLKNQAFFIIIFVPEGMVSLLIGTKGHQINKIMKQSRTIIIINQPINKMTYRTAKIQGNHADIAQACKIIYQMLQQKSSIAYSIQKQPSQFDYTKSKIKTKLLLEQTVCNYLKSRKKALIRKLQDESKCFINFRQDSNYKSYKKQEQQCVIVGKLEDVQVGIVVIMNLINEYYYIQRQKRYLDYTIKILIPSNYVTKLIGQKGYMIRDIIERSGGAQIKILSDKQNQRDTKECIITINGSRQNKVDAICLILEQIQCFKNGGPILQSAQQFKNSVSMKQEQLFEKGMIDETVPVIIPFHKQFAHGETTSITQYINSPIKDIKQPMKLIQKFSEQKSQEGLIEQGQQVPKLQAKFLQNPRKNNNLEVVSQSNRTQRSVSHDRSRQRKNRSRNQSSNIKQFKRKKSQSESVQFIYDKNYTQIKLLIPQKLAQDFRQIEYIQSISKSSLQIGNKFDHNKQTILTIKGSIKDNSRCIKLIQKRLARLNNLQTSLEK